MIVYLYPFIQFYSQEKTMKLPKQSAPVERFIATSAKSIKGGIEASWVYYDEDFTNLTKMLSSLPVIIRSLE
jgi:hypothetical protein